MYTFSETGLNIYVKQYCKQTHTVTTVSNKYKDKSEGSSIFTLAHLEILLQKDREKSHISLRSIIQHFSEREMNTKLYNEDGKE